MLSDTHKKEERITAFAGERARSCCLVSPSKQEENKRGIPPLHDDQQAFLPVVHVLVQADDAHDVRPPGHAPVELHLSSGFGAVVKNLGKPITGRHFAVTTSHIKLSIFDEDAGQEERNRSNTWV